MAGKRKEKNRLGSGRFKMSERAFCSSLRRGGKRAFPEIIIGRSERDYFDCFCGTHLEAKKMFPSGGDFSTGIFLGFDGGWNVKYANNPGFHLLRAVGQARRKVRGYHVRQKYTTLGSKGRISIDLNVR